MKNIAPEHLNEVNEFISGGRSHGKLLAMVERIRERGIVDILIVCRSRESSRTAWAFCKRELPDHTVRRVFVGDNTFGVRVTNKAIAT